MEKDIDDRLEKLEKKYQTICDLIHIPSKITAAHIYLSAIRDGFSSFRISQVPGNYYDTNIYQRAKAIDPLSPPHISSLCKSLIIQNYSWRESIYAELSDDHKQYYEQFYLIVIPYVTTYLPLNFLSFIKEAGAKVGLSIPSRAYHFNFAKEETSFKLCGYAHNAVTPVGSRTRLVMVLDKSIHEGAKTGFFWLGGGDIDLKLGLSVKEFTKIYKPLITDVTELRETSDPIFGE
ncbi:hypothetical protein ADUPG1_006427 [Aduncisulcus paluster]|uniref:Uncharacterized protein n=1 Tax=Aduncisulcus paluster TaxID=2918883 RepID=A0ABQ5KI77_9EUKA|nr:hypothetical protein ADUPG1_006427 [Aduncisulcus paluster]